MKKMIFATLMMVATTFGAFAQNSAKPLRFSLGLDAALPMGDFGDLYSFGIGGSAQANYWLDESLAITGNVGFMSYSPKSVGGAKSPNYSAIPILAGIEYNFTPQVFASAQLGVSMTKVKGFDSESAFTYAPGIGFRLGQNASALLKYQAMSKNSVTNSQIGLRLAYTF